MVDYYVPKRVLYEVQALDYPLGKKLVEAFRKKGVDTQKIPSHNRITTIPGKTAAQAYREGKRTLVIGVRREKDFQTCKPSAHYQLPLVTGCSGMCEYCYLATNLGKKPYMRVYVNVEEILNKTKELIDSRSPELTLFEGSAVSDPVPIELYSGLLRNTIEFFALEEYGRFRFVTKFTDIDSLLGLQHNNHTTIRFSINSDFVIKNFEHGTPNLEKRVEAAYKVFQAGYKLGFLIAPIVIYPGWEEGYEKLYEQLSRFFYNLPKEKMQEITLELISHRYTTRAKNNILDIFPNTQLDMNEEQRKYKYGQFGYGKYVYPSEEMSNLKERFKLLTDQYLPGVETLYFV